MSIPDWKWSSSSFNFENSFSSEFSKTIFYKSPKGDRQLKNIFEKYEIMMSKNFSFSEQKGWIWHKTSNIPSLFISLVKNQAGLQVNNAIFVGLYLVKKVVENDALLIDLGLKGNNVLKLDEKKEDSIKISKLKVNTTSFYHNGEKFKLLISFFEENNNRKNSLFTLLSPEFSVYSRETSKNNSKLEQLTPYLKPFSPESLKKNFLKKNNGNEFSAIGNSLEGLCNYLSAQNLKFKIKHPLFLLFKFSNVFSLYGKPCLSETNENMILRLQNYLNAKSSHLLSKISIPLKKSDDFLLYMKDENFKGNLLKHQRVNEFIQILNNHIIPVIMNKNDIPFDYEEQKNLKELKDLYKQSYPELYSEKMFNLLNNKDKKFKSFATQNYEKFKKDDQILKKKVKIERNETNLSNANHINFIRTPLIKEINFTSYEKPQIQVVSSIHSAKLIEKTKEENVSEDLLKQVFELQTNQNLINEMKNFVEIQQLYKIWYYSSLMKFNGTSLY